MDGKWQSEIAEKQSAICLQMGGEHAHYVEEQGSSYCIRIKQKQTKQSKFVKIAVINNQ